MTQLWATTEYDPRKDREPNHIYAQNHLALPQYSNNNGVSYLNNNGHYYYSNVGPLYAAYPTSITSGQDATGSLLCSSSTGAVSMPYHMQSPPGATLPSQPRTFPQYPPYFMPSLQSQRLSSQHARSTPATEVELAEAEEQESPNDESMRSEPIDKPLDGYPNVDDFDDLMNEYVQNLSPKKQDKALIHAKRAANIRAVLIDKKTTSVESAQFRFWVKKMFTLEPREPCTTTGKRRICHEGKPVAIREKLFKILTRAHRICSHGGRDKTSTQVRRVYSWVPKELISRFVKLCPTCQMRRGTSRTSPPVSEMSSGTYLDPQSPELDSANQSRRQSVATSTNSSLRPQFEMARFSATFQQQNRWMTAIDTTEKQEERGDMLESPASAMVDINMSSPVSPGSLTPVPSKFSDDPGSTYFPAHHNAGSSVGMQYHRHGFHAGHNLSDIYQSDHSYRMKRASPIKREQRY